MVLEDRDIIQICATIIAGAVIFLTILTVIPNASDTTNDKYYRSVGVHWAGLIIIPFGISAVLAIIGRLKLAKGMMGISFVMLIFIMLIFIMLVMVLVSSYK